MLPKEHFEQNSWSHHWVFGWTKKYFSLIVRERERESPIYLPNYTYFSVIILRANQTLETIFQHIFENTTKKLKIVSFQKIFSPKKFYSQKIFYIEPNTT